VCSLDFPTQVVLRPVVAHMDWFVPIQVVVHSVAGRTEKVRTDRALLVHLVVDHTDQRLLAHLVVDRMDQRLLAHLVVDRTDQHLLVHLVEDRMDRGRLDHNRPAVHCRKPDRRASLHLYAELLA